VLALWIALSACSGDDADTGGTTSVGGCETGADPTLVIGTGEQAYEPMRAEVGLVHGPQGGYHVLIAFEATHLADGLIGGQLSGTLDGEVVATSAPWLELRCNPDTDTQQVWGQLLIYSNGGLEDLQPEDLDGQPTTIKATLTDVDGTAVSASVDTVIVDPLVE
jgi:hypothetical protein